MNYLHPPCKFGGVLKSMLLKSVNRKIENIETKCTIFSRFYNIEVVSKI